MAEINPEGFIVGAPEHPFPIGMRNATTIAAQLRRGASPAPKPTAPLPLCRAVILDKAAAAKLDPCIPERFVLPQPSASFVVTVDGVEAVRIEATDAGQPHGWCSEALYSAICEQHGVDDDPEQSTLDFLGEAFDASRPLVAAIASLSSPLEAWRGAPEVLRRMLESLLRAHGVALAQVAGVVGRPYVARKSLLTAGSIAAKVAAQREELRAQEARSAEAAAARATEQARPRTLGELGLHGVEVRPSDIAGLPPLLSSLAPSWRSPAGHLFLTWLAIAGFEPPTVDLGTIRVLGPDELVPTGAGAPQPVTNDVYRFVAELRKAEGAADTGPVEVFSAEGLERGRQLVRRYMVALLAVVPNEGWRRGHLAELLVRALRFRPDVAVDVVCSAMAAAHRARFQSFTVPRDAVGREGIGPSAELESRHEGFARLRAQETVTVEPPPIPPHAWQRYEIEAACVAAARGGVVSPGALLPSTQDNAPARAKHLKGKS